nr:MAG TPA: hypothetical protein [Caudoviricetes sp.]
MHLPHTVHLLSPVHSFNAHTVLCIKNKPV